MTEYRIYVKFDGQSHQFTVERPIGTPVSTVENEFTKGMQVSVQSRDIPAPPDRDPSEWYAEQRLAELDGLKHRLEETLSEPGVSVMAKNASAIDIFRRCDQILADEKNYPHPLYKRVVERAQALRKEIGRRAFGIDDKDSDGA